MQRFLALLFVLVALSCRANDCLTNLSVSTIGGWTFTVAGSGSECYNGIQSYTNLMCHDLMASSCDEGTALIFSTAGCPASANDVATVNFTCNTAVNCIQGGQGGAIACQSGGHFTITIRPGVYTFAVRIYPSWLGCCHMTYCTFAEIECLVSGGGPGGGQ